jgi:hypothetical protein
MTIENNKTKHSVIARRPDPRGISSEAEIGTTEAIRVWCHSELRINTARTPDYFNMNVQRSTELTPKS